MKSSDHSKMSAEKKLPKISIKIPNEKESYFMTKMMTRWIELIKGLYEYSRPNTNHCFYPLYL